jgi:hypothetical protein
LIAGDPVRRGLSDLSGNLHWREFLVHLRHMEKSLDTIEEAVVQNMASGLVRDGEIMVILSIVAELARRMDYPGLVARCSRSSFELECRNSVGKSLLKLSEEHPQLVKAVYARLREMRMAPEDALGKYS